MTSQRSSTVSSIFWLVREVAMIVKQMLWVFGFTLALRRSFARLLPQQSARSLSSWLAHHFACLIRSFALARFLTPLTDIDLPFDYFARSLVRSLARSPLQSLTP